MVFKVVRHIPSQVTVSQKHGRMLPCLRGLGPALCISHAGVAPPHLPPSSLALLLLARAQPAFYSFPPYCCCSLRSISVIAPSGSAAAATDDPRGARFGGNEKGGSLHGLSGWLIGSLSFFSGLPPVPLDLSLFWLGVGRLAPCERFITRRRLKNTTRSQIQTMTNT
jgi:hypothetical protein